MKKIIASSLIAFMALSTACGDKKVQDKQESSGDANKAEAKPAVQENQQGSTAPASSQPAAPEKLTVTYPPIIGVFPLSAPGQNRSLYFGFTAGGTPAYQMIWAYAVAAIPNFRAAATTPNFKTEAEFDAFMDKWANEFKATPEMVAALDKKATEFSFKVDPAFFSDAAFTIPAAFLNSLLPYEKATQKYFARRYTTKAAGSTAITATDNGATFSVPVVITDYAAAQLTAGKAKYDAMGSCVGCHGTATANQDAFLKHSSDYLAYATDAEILGIIKTGTYPDGTLMANSATHKFTLTAAEEPALVGYLRSFPPSLDKLGGVANPPALTLK